MGAEGNGDEGAGTGGENSLDIGGEFGDRLDEEEIGVGEGVVKIGGAAGDADIDNGAGAEAETADVVWFPVGVRGEPAVWRGDNALDLPSRSDQLSIDPVFEFASVHGRGSSSREWWIFKGCIPVVPQ